MLQQRTPLRARSDTVACRITAVVASVAAAVAAAMSVILSAQHRTHTYCVTAVFTQADSSASSAD
jgi:hypothetical protein